ncbi:MAG TPA: hypothetical protein VGO11_17995 [Chthoniobacteraceae bacterium]|jgi:preprotein translocase subunit SecD|nr:hypothetical protein [Chthoniobacteraceae bacterium]
MRFLFVAIVALALRTYLFGQEGAEHRPGIAFSVQLTALPGAPEPLISADLRERTIAAIRERLAVFGEKNIGLSAAGDDRVICQITGLTVSGLDRARELLQRRAVVEMRMVAKNSDAILNGVVPFDPEYIPMKRTSPAGSILVSKKVLLGSPQIRRATPFFANKAWTIDLGLTEAGAKMFSCVMRAHANKEMAITLDGEVAASVRLQSTPENALLRIPVPLGEAETRDLATAAEHPFEVGVKILDEAKF